MADKEGLFGQVVTHGGIAQAGDNLWHAIDSVWSPGQTKAETPDQAQLREGAQKFHGISKEKWDDMSAEDKAKSISSYINSPKSPYFSKSTFSKVKNEVAQAAPVAKSSSAQTKAYEQQIASGPWSELGQSLVKQYQQAETPTLAAISGTLTPSAEQSATAQAEAAVGGVPASSSSWLSAQEAAANANSGPVEAAMAAEGKQYAAEEKPITAALTAYGQANEAALASAPESSWLNAALSHITSNVSYYGEVPTTAVASLEQTPSLVQALEEAGGQGGTTEGLTPLTSIKAKGVNAPSTASAALTPTAGTVSTGSVPPAGTNAGAG